jgi:hypothetical protein
MTDIKGHLIIVTKQYVVDTYNVDNYNEMLKNLNPVTKDILSGTIISNNWYNINIYKEMLDAFEKKFSRSEMKKLSEYNAKKQMGPFFGFFAKLISTKKLISMTQNAFSKIYSEGKAELISYEEQKFLMKISGIEFNESMKYGFMWYIEYIAIELYQKRFIGSFKTIDKTTTEFTFIKMLK